MIVRELQSNSLIPNEMRDERKRAKKVRELQSNSLIPNEVRDERKRAKKVRELRGKIFCGGMP